MSDTTIADLLAGRPLVAILRGVAPSEAVRIAQDVWDSGLGVVEVPIQTPQAVPSLVAVAAAARERGERCGAGTVISVEQVRVAADAGAMFTVAPGFDPEVVRASVDAGLPHLPGVATASEIQQALRAGCSWLKAFPAGALGPAWFRDMRGPFPGIGLVATGGVGAPNAREFLDAGAVAVGVGGAITRPGGLAQLLAVLGE